MTIKYLRNDAGFTVGDTESGLTAYAYPKSTHWYDAEHTAESTGKAMIRSAQSWARGYGDGFKEACSAYDARNWEALGGRS